MRLALLAFLIDVAVRRLAINPVEAARRLRRLLRDLAGHPAPATVATLRGLRDRVRQSQTSLDADAPAEPSATPGGAASGRAGDEELTRLLNGRHDRPALAAPAKRPPASQQGEPDYPAKLLRAKRRTQDDDNR